MSSATEDSIEDELRASGFPLSYADWADVHAGRYEEAAQRVHRLAKSMRRRGIIVRSLLSVFVVYELVRYFQTSRVPYLVSGGVVGFYVLSSQLMAFLAYRYAVRIADRLRRAAVEAPRSAVVQ